MSNNQHRNHRLEFVKRSDIDIGDRMRTIINGKAEGETLEELAESISFFGSVLQPIVLMDKASSVGDLDQGHFKDRPYLLVAGGRRYSAHLDAKVGDEIPAIIFEGWSMGELRNAEFDENKLRKSMTPAEEILAAERTHLHWVKEAAKKGETWTIRDTAKRIGRSKSTVSNMLNQAEAIHANPELKEATTKKQIAKNIKKKERQSTAAKISALVDLQYKLGGEEKLDKEFISSYRIKDFLKASFKPGFQLIEFDPDYGFGLTDKRKDTVETSQEKMEGYGALTSEFKSFMKEALVKCYDLADKDAWIWVWGDMEFANWIQDEIQNAGFETKPWYYMVWCKPTGQNRWPSYQRASATELCFYGCKGRPHMIAEGKKNWFEYPIPIREGRHPTEKPIEMYEQLLQEWVFRGSKILVPCAGSYNVGFAANNLDMKPQGTDITKAFRDEFVTRVKTMKKPWRSF